MTSAKWFGVAVLSLGTAAGTGWAVASPDQDGGPRAAWRARGGQRLAQYLGLTDQQQAQWKTMRQQQREQMKPLLEEGRTLRRKLQQALGASQPDPQAVGQATIDLKAHREKVRAQRDQFRQQLAGILDPQQKQKLDALQQMRRTMGRGHGWRGAGPLGGGAGAPLS